MPGYSLTALKAMHAMKAMKTKKAKKGTWEWFFSHWRHTQRKMVFSGGLNNTSGGIRGLLRSDLVKNKYGKIVSKKLSCQGKKKRWPAAIKAARKALNLVGFVAIKKGSPLYNMVKKLYKK